MADQQQPSFGKSALKAILIEAIVLACALVFFLISIGTPVLTGISGSFSFVQLANILVGIAIFFGIAVGIFILVLAVQAGKLNVSKVLRFDMEKIAKLILYVLLICGAIFLVAAIVGNGITANMLWGAWILGLVGIGLAGFLLFIGILTFAAQYQKPREVPAEVKA